MMWVRYLAATLALACGGTLFAQDVESGPPKGKKVPGLKVHAVSGPLEGKTLDYVKERKGAPTVYVLIPKDKWDRPVHRFLKTLDEEIKKRSDQAFIVAVWLTDDKDATKGYLPKIAQYYQNTALTYYPGEKTGPNEWGINDQAHVTVVVANKGQVLASLGYQSINETVVREVLSKFGKEKK